MTKAEYIKLHADLCQRMIDITKAKNSDYTGKGDDPFANFRQVELDGICSTELGFLTRMSDKWSRIRSLMSTNGVGQVKDESLEDTLLDMANYCLLLIGFRRSLQPIKTPTQGATAMVSVLKEGEF